VFTAVPDSAFSMSVLPGISEPAIRGQARLRVFGFSIHDATLFTQRGEAYVAGKPAALQLVYLRSFSAEQLTKSTQEELERVLGPSPTVAADTAKLATCFRDVKASDSFTAITSSPNDLRLYLNGQQTCKLNDPQLATRFLSIWLSDKSRSPAMSKKLRGN